MASGYRQPRPEHPNPGSVPRSAPNGFFASRRQRPGEGDPRLKLALKIIAENKGKMSLTMNALAHDMAHRYATEQLTDGELEKAKEGMRNYLKKAVTGELATYAHKAGKAKKAPWEFEDRRKDRSAA